MRSTVGGVGMPTGEGVTNSPTSPLISAMTPANGATRRVRSSCACATFDLRRRRAGRVARRLTRCGVGRGRRLRLVGRLLRGQLLRVQPHEPVGLALRVVGHDAGLLGPRSGGLRVTLRKQELRLDVLVPELEQQLPLFDVLAFLRRQPFDLPALRRGESGPAARVDRARAGVGHGRGDGAAVDDGHLHRNGLGASGPPNCGRNPDHDDCDDPDPLHVHRKKKGSEPFPGNPLEVTAVRERPRASHDCSMRARAAKSVKAADCELPATNV